jgi:tRNA(Ile)-lysidine synthase
MMDVVLPPGKYVIAMSGGVDSMVLLDMLRREPEIELTVAHFDHGMRADSAKDRQFVQQIAAVYKLPFVYEAGNLGAHASEATAREARYRFLRQVQQKSGAQAILVAHHQDDVLETALLNLLRGTGRLGLSSLRSQNDILRPLLHIPKQEILAYAKAQALAWHEDLSNQDERYVRNYIRHTILPRFSKVQQAQLLAYIRKARELNDELDYVLTNALHAQPTRDQLDRRWFSMLPYTVSTEVLAAWLRSHGVRSFDKKLIHQLVVAAKTLSPGKQRDVNTTFVLRITKDVLYLTRQPLRKNRSGHV